MLEDVNRYAAKPIVMADPAIGDLPITGTVFDLESAFGLKAAEEPERIVLRRGD